MEYLNLKEVVYDNITFDIKQNVKTIFTTNDICQNTNTNKKLIEFYNTSINTNDVKVFFLFETEYHNAFSHWVFENAVFLPYFKYFPKNVLVLVNKNEYRTYKKLFFNLFNIPEDNLYYIDNTIDQPLDYKLIPQNNICIICRNLRMNTQIRNNMFSNIFTNLTSNFYNEIHQNHNFDYTKKIKHLFFPRNKKENFKPNDRLVNYMNVSKFLKGNEYVTYNTEDTIDIKDQIQLLLSAENVYLEGGSSYFVNGLFCKDSKLYIYGNVTNSSERNLKTYNLLQLIKDAMVKNNNYITYIG